MIAALALLHLAASPIDLDRVRPKIDEYFKNLQHELGFPGVSYAVSTLDGKVIKGSFGYADLQAQTKLKPEDRQQAGSIGKTFFATVMLQYLDEAKIGLDTKISKWLGEEPWFKRLPNHESITLRQLMNHTSGIPEHVESPQMMKALAAAPDKVWKPEELIGMILDKPAVAPAGERFSYADTNYIVMGMIFEKASGKNFYREVERRLLEPLQLTRTIPAVSRTVPELANGYGRKGSPFPWDGPMIRNGKFVFNTQMEWTGGGFSSTAADLARWSCALYGGKVLTESQKAEMFNGVPANTGRDHQYGLGVQIRPSPFGTTYGHGGWFPGYLSEMEYFPSKSLAIAVQFNTDDVGLLRALPHKFVLDTMKLVAGE